MGRTSSAAVACGPQRPGGGVFSVIGDYMLADGHWRLVSGMLPSDSWQLPVAGLTLLTEPWRCVLSGAAVWLVLFRRGGETTGSEHQLSWTHWGAWMHLWLTKQVIAYITSN